MFAVFYLVSDYDDVQCSVVVLGRRLLVSLSTYIEVHWLKL